jgi:hypothetical protein
MQLAEVYAASVRNTEAARVTGSSAWTVGHVKYAWAFFGRQPPPIRVPDQKIFLFVDGRNFRLRREIGAWADSHF